MNDLLHNPVYYALCTGDQQLSFGTEQVKYYDEAVSPYAGFPDTYPNGFADLYALLPPDRKILYANPVPITQPGGWFIQHHIEGLQFIYEGPAVIEASFPNIVPLKEEHVDEMIELVKLTKPGPFGKRTIDFGFYHGIFDNGKLVAMTGQRLHVANYTEISAVCTHLNHLGKGYATALLQHQLKIILQQNEIPFLHVRADNDRAIAVYERLGFRASRPMHFYFMKKEIL